MSRTEKVQRISALLHSFSNDPLCDLNFAAGLRAFSDSLTSSHSLTSKTPSLRALIQCHLDQPFLEALNNYSGKWNPNLLEGKLLSEMLYKPCSDSEPSSSNEMTADKYTNNLLAWCHRLRKIIHTIQDSKISGHVLKSIDEWDTIDPNFSIQGREANISEKMKLIATLNCAQLTLKNLIYLRPKSGTLSSKQRFQLELTGVEVPMSPILDSRTRPQEESLCELCWRTTIRSMAMKSQENAGSPYSQARKLSNRYCHIHNPSDPTSKYRRDLPYKKIFHDELNAYYFNLGRSQFVLKPILPSSPDEQEVRKALYEMIRMGTYSVSAKSDSTPRLMQRVLLKYQEGMKQSEIARQLGISKQAVSAQLKKARKYVSTRAKAINDPSSMD